MSEAWRRCRQWLLPALEPGDGAEADLIAEIETGSVELWIGEAGALATQYVVEPEGPCLHIWLAGGSLNEIMTLRPGLEAYARGRGCLSVTVDGRVGWSRMLRPFGYARTGTELKRML